MKRDVDFNYGSQFYSIPANPTKGRRTVANSVPANNTEFTAVQSSAQVSMTAPIVDKCTLGGSELSRNSNIETKVVSIEIIIPKNPKINRLNR